MPRKPIPTLSGVFTPTETPAHLARDVIESALREAIMDGRIPPETPLRQEEIDHILGHIDRRKAQEVDDIPFMTGDQVKVNDGAFKDFVGTVQEVIPEKRRLKIMVSIFGRGTPVELDVLQVEPAEETTS